MKLDFLDEVMDGIRNKIAEREQTMTKLIKDCKATVDKKIQQAAKGSEKINKIIEQNVLIMMLNDRMEAQNRQYFKDNFIHRNMYIAFIKQPNTNTFRSAKDFQACYRELIDVELSTNKFYTDYRRKLDQEMQKFTGKMQAGETETNASEMTS